jgi:DNA-binding CsgD family transcriptional regulator
MKINTPSWIKYIHQRISKNKNFLGIVVGKTGSGKTFSALSMAEQLDPEFNINRVCFKATELMKLINSGSLKSGSVVLWDEAGIDLSNRSWQSAINKVMNYLLQTFRHRNFILLFTSPDLGFIDASTRRLFHTLFQTTKINIANKTCALKPKLMDYNPTYNKIYTPYLKVRKNGHYVKIKVWNVKMPSKKLVEEYEKKKNEYTDKLNREIEKTLISLEEKDNDNDSIKSNKKELTDKQKQILELIQKNRIDDTAKIIGIGSSSVREQMKRIIKKGYKLTSIKDDVGKIKYYTFSLDK